MHKGILAQPKGCQPARRKTISLLMLLPFTLVSMTAYAPQAEAQVPVGLGISLGSALLSGVAKRHVNRRIDVKNKAIDSNNRGVKQFEQKQYQQAIDSFSEALEIDPSFMEVHWNLAIAYKHIGDYKNCLTETEQVLRTKSADAEVLFMAAIASQHLRQFGEADEYYKRYLSKNKSGENTEYAERAQQIIEHIFLSAPDGDYIVDATREGRSHWPGEKMPLKVFIQEDNSIASYVPEFASSLRQAFTDWADISEGRVSFSFTDNQSEAQIVCAWTDDKMRLGGTKELGLTHREEQDNAIIAARIDLYTFADRPELKKDEIMAAAKQVDLHEIGHALGLEHSQQPYDIMYFETTPDGLEFPLTPRDKNTILAMYSQPAAEIAQLLTRRNYASSSFSPSIDKMAIRLQDESPVLK